MKNDWISVDDRLPKTRDDAYGTDALSIDVLIIDENNDQMTGFYNYSQAGDVYCENPWEELFTECPISTKITHWMPLPKPPNP